MKDCRTYKFVSVHHENIQVLAINLFKTINFLATKIVSRIFEKKRRKSNNLKNKNIFKSRRINIVQYDTDILPYMGSKVQSIALEDSKKLELLDAFKAKVKKLVPGEYPCTLHKPFIKNLGYLQF